MNIPKFPNFVPVSLAIKDELLTHITKYQSSICDLCLGYLLIWEQFDHAAATLINNNLCILLHENNNPPTFLEPIGNHDITDTIKICLDYCGSISHVSERFLSSLANVSNYKLTELPDIFDYVYQTTELAELKGSKFHSKRNHISNFKKNFPDYKYHAITAAFKPSALDIFAQWSSTTTPNKNAKISLEIQANALNKAFTIFSDCNFTGGYIEANAKILGFILGSELNHETFVAHFEYCLPEAQGVYQLLLQELCKKIQPHYSFINLEEDLGIAGLRKMKLSYHPYAINKKYQLTFAALH